MEFPALPHPDYVKPAEYLRVVALDRLLALLGEGVLEVPVDADDFVEQASVLERYIRDGATAKDGAETLKAG